MDRYPYAKPPRWWSPLPNRRWMRLWRLVRRYQQHCLHRVTRVDVCQIEHVNRAIENGHGVLITPNHSSHADCFALLNAMERVEADFYVMTAWQVFQSLSPVMRFAYRHHGCFSIDREGNDLHAFRESVRVLGKTNSPLVIFPEGEVYHLNDRVKPFRDGTMSIVMSAVRRSERPVSCVPCAMKYHYVQDPTPELVEVVNRLEDSFALSRGCHCPLAARLERIIEAAVQSHETRYLGGTLRGPLQQRIDSMADTILSRLEKKYVLPTSSVPLPERVKELRKALIEKQALAHSADVASGVARDMEDVFVAVQLYSYEVDYIAECPTIERIAETVDKYEEDFLGFTTARIRGVRRAKITFGKPVVVDQSVPRDQSGRVGETLRQRVQTMLDHAESPSRQISA